MTGVPALHPFVVTGCPRSGTHYLSEVIARVGLVCGHEEVFGPRDHAFRGFGAAHGDSSWLAVPFLGQLPGDAVVLHQVRHPLAVVRSLVGIGFLEDVPRVREGFEDRRAALRWRLRLLLAQPLNLPPSTLGPRPMAAFRRFLRAQAPEVFAEPTPSERALRVWVAWNEAATGNARGLAGYRRYRVEDLDGRLLRDLLGDIGLPVTEEQAALALSTASRDLNSRDRADLTWTDLPAGRALDDATRLAEAYGYVPGSSLVP